MASSIRLVSLLFAILFLTSCGKSNPPAPKSPIANRQSPILTLHWLGKTRLSAESNATNFISIWNMPESLKLETQTLDKLSTAPWRLLASQTTVSNAPSALLRPLLNDLIQEETYLEIAAVTNQPTEAVLAIKLSPDRAALWQTNLPIILKSIFREASEPKVAHSGDYQLSTKNHQLTLTRSGNWTILSISDLRLLASDLSLALSIRDRITATGIPYVSSSSNDWLGLSMDARRMNNAFNWGWDFVSDLPLLTLGIAGDASNVRTTGELKFSRDLKLNLEAWRIPTNYICDPLLSFTAVRGIARQLNQWEGWREEKMGNPPNQLFFWAQSPALWSHYLTYPVQNASNHVAALGDWVLREWNPIFKTNKVGEFAWSTNKFGLVWMGVPFFKPVIEPARFESSDYALIGLFANNSTNRPVPPALFAEFNAKPNLIYYDWEITGPQVNSWTQMGQLMRMVFGRPQMSPRDASLPWLRAMIPSLGNASTVLTLESPTQISFKRSSTVGLTSVELHLLADWLESPEFPIGLHTMLATRPVRPQSVSTNLPPR